MLYIYIYAYGQKAEPLSQFSYFLKLLSYVFDIHIPRKLCQFFSFLHESYVQLVLVSDPSFLIGN